MMAVPTPPSPHTSPVLRDHAIVAAGTEVTIDGRQLSLSNLDKVLYPESGFTKAQVIDYYVRIAPVLLPHIRGRLLTLKRYPNGVDAGFFYEKQCPSHAPSWVRTQPIPSTRKGGRTIDYCVVDEVATLAWVANLASLELHTSLACADDWMRPTMVVFDLDPGPPAAIAECARVALLLREVFDSLSLTAVVKTSGSKGLQVYAPLNTPCDYGGTKVFSKSLAELLERVHPELVVSSQRKDLRGGKVLIDWSQNDEHKTTVCVYSLRARSQPTVSAPVTWTEVEAAVTGPDTLSFTADAVLERAERLGDLFEAAVTVRQELPRL
jgi:bifunctional non-homologous end joining protein LigD